MKLFDDYFYLNLDSNDGDDQSNGCGCAILVGLACIALTVIFLFVNA